MADKTFVLRVAIENGQPVVKYMEDLGDKGEKAARKIRKAASDEANPAMRGLNAAMVEGQQAMDGYVRRAGPFGQVLASMGKGGYAAAAAVGAVTVAAVLLTGKITSAVAAMDDLADKSQRLQINVETLQALRLAARDAGFELEQGDAAAEALRDARLKALSGTRGSKKGLKLFQDFGISKEELLQLSDVEGLLNRISQGAKAMGNDMVAAAKLAELGLKPLTDLLLNMPGYMEDAVAELKAMGVIIDASIVQKGAEANAAWELMSSKIDAQLTPVFIRLAETALPVLEKILNLLAGIIKILPPAMDGFAAAWSFASGDILGGAAALQRAMAREGVGPGAAPGVSTAYAPGTRITKGTATSEDMAMLRREKPRNQFIPGGDDEDSEGAAAAKRAEAEAERERAAALKLVLDLKGKEAEINEKLKDDIAQLRRGHELGVEGLKTEAELNAAIADATARAAAESQKARDEQSKWIKGIIAGADELIAILDGVEQRQEGVNLRMGVFNQLLSGSISSLNDILDLLIDIVTQIVQMAAQMAIDGKGDFWSNIVDIAGGLFGFGGGSSSTLTTLKPVTPNLSFTPFPGRAGGGATQAGRIYRWDETGGEKFIMANRDGYVANPHQVADMAARHARGWQAAAGGAAQPVLVSSVVENHGPPMDQKTETRRGADGRMELRTILTPIVTDIQKENIQGGRTDAALRSRVGARPRLQSR